MLFINHIARLLKIKRPEPFEIEIPKTDTFSNDGSADDERTNELLYGHELGGIDKGALVSLKSPKPSDRATESNFKGFRIDVYRASKIIWMYNTRSWCYK